MQRRLLISLLVAGVIVLAVGGWTVRGLRWTVGGARTPQPA